MMPRRSVDAQLEELRQATVAERTKLRDVETEQEAAKARVADASDSITAAYALEDNNAVKAAQADLQAIESGLADLAHRVAGAQLRVQTAQRTADEFVAEHAEALIESRAAAARELAFTLTRAGHDLIAAHRAYVAVRTDIDALVKAIPNAVVRSDGPPASHAWEPQLRDLERSIRQHPAVDPPLPRWTGRDQRRQEQDTHRRLREERNQQARTTQRQKEVA